MRRTLARSLTLGTALALVVPTAAAAHGPDLSGSAVDAVVQALGGDAAAAPGATGESVDGVVEVAPGVTVEVPGQAALAGREDRGFAVFGEEADPTQFVVRRTDVGWQLFSVSSSAASPETFSYDVELAADQRLEETVDGGVAIVAADGTLVATVGAPWARDAAGESVATWYEVSGASIVQHVAHRGAGVTYPVVADPDWKNCGVNVCLRFTKAETRSIANGSTETVSRALGVACKVFPIGVKQLCSIYVKAAQHAIVSVAKKAVAQKKCMQWAPFLLGTAKFYDQIVPCSR